MGSLEEANARTAAASWGSMWVAGPRDNMQIRFRYSSGKSDNREFRVTELPLLNSKNSSVAVGLEFSK